MKSVIVKAIMTKENPVFKVSINSAIRSVLIYVHAVYFEPFSHVKKAEFPLESSAI